MTRVCIGKLNNAKLLRLEKEKVEEEMRRQQRPKELLHHLRPVRKNLLKSLLVHERDKEESMALVVYFQVLGFSFFSRNNANKETPATLTTLKRTPGISPLACPLRPNPAIKTSS